MANLAEGFHRGENRYRIHFLLIAKGSPADVQAQLHVALDAGYIARAQFERLYQLAGDTGELLGGFIRYLRRHGLQVRIRTRHPPLATRSPPLAPRDSQPAARNPPLARRTSQLAPRN